VFADRFRVLREGETGIDFDLLRQKDEMLFFDEMVLYQVDSHICYYDIAVVKSLLKSRATLKIAAKLFSMLRFVLCPGAGIY